MLLEDNPTFQFTPIHLIMPPMFEALVSCCGSRHSSLLSKLGHPKSFFPVCEGFGGARQAEGQLLRKLRQPAAVLPTRRILQRPAWRPLQRPRSLRPSGAGPRRRSGWLLPPRQPRGSEGSLPTAGRWKPVLLKKCFELEPCSKSVIVGNAR